MVVSGTKVTESTYEHDVKKKAILWWVNLQSADSSGEGLVFQQTK
jgi:hypothetical protein